MADSESTGTMEDRRYAPSRMDSKASELDLDFCAQQVRRAGRFLELGKIEAAEASLHQGLDRVPEHPECVAYLAVCMAAGRRKYVTAEKLIKIILNKNPYDATAWYAMGRINLLGGRRKQAFKNFAKAKLVSRDDVNVEIAVEQMDPRQSPVLTFLPRDNFLNVFLGRLRSHFN